MPADFPLCIAAEITGKETLSESTVSRQPFIIARINPYLECGLLVDYLLRGRFHLIPRHPQVLKPDGLSALTAAARLAQNPDSAGIQAPGAAANDPAGTQPYQTANSGQKEMKAMHD